MASYVTGQNFMQHLINIGAIPDAPYQKVIIEADVDEVVKIYTQALGVDTLLHVSFTEPAIIVEAK